MKIFFIAAAVLMVLMTCGMVFTYGPLHAEGSMNEGDILAKLEEVSKSQQEMMAAINSLKEEIQIIKIRVTQSQ